MEGISTIPVDLPQLFNHSVRGILLPTDDVYLRVLAVLRELVSCMLPYTGSTSYEDGDRVE